MTDDMPEGVKMIRVGDEQGRGGLYNMVRPGGFDRGEILLPILGIRQWSEVGRFRDAWLVHDDEGNLMIQVYTRNGGGNREDQKEAIDAMRANPLYLRDEDDQFDKTYASFFFRLPDEHVELVRDKDLAIPVVDTAQMWRDIGEALHNTGR